MHGVTEEENKKVFVIPAMGMSVYLSLLVFNLKGVLATNHKNKKNDIGVKMASN